MSTRDAWMERATAVVDATRPLLDNYGLAPSDRLAIAFDGHPCPGYRHETQQILLCPPVIETNIDRLRWLFFCRVMGCADVDEAARFYESALPFIVCHELGHHLRYSLGLESDSSFIEEQVCDHIGVALVSRLPELAGTLEPMVASCREMRSRLAVSYSDRPGTQYLPGLGEVLVGSDELDNARLSALEALSRDGDVPLTQLLAVAVGSDEVARATAARASAQQLVDSRYTEDPSEYWYLCLNWIVSYFDRPRRNDLQDVVRDHLRPRAPHAALATLGADEPMTSPRERAASLPARGGADWRAAMVTMAGHRTALLDARDSHQLELVQRARASALLADLGACEGVDERLVDVLLSRCGGLVALGKALGDSRLCQLARAQLDKDVNRAVVELSRLLAPTDKADATAALSARPDLAMRAVPPGQRDAIIDAMQGDAAAGSSDSPVVNAAQTYPDVEDRVLTNIEKTLALDLVPLFGHLEPDRLWQLAERAVDEVIEPDEAVFREGEPGHRLFVIIDGHVRVEKRQEDGSFVELALLGRGACFGEMALFDGQPRSATARAVDRCQLLSVDRHALERIGRQRPEVYEALLRSMSERLRATSEQLVG